MERLLGAMIHRMQFLESENPSGSLDTKKEIRVLKELRKDPEALKVFLNLYEKPVKIVH